MKLHALFFAAFLLPAPAFSEEQQFKNGEVINIQPDRAYVLVRTLDIRGKARQGTVKVAPILIRVLNNEELRQADALFQSDPKRWREKAESNIVELLPDEFYAQANGEVVLLAAIRPGTYVLGGVASVNRNARAIGIMAASLCMGTVKFEAKAGIVSDLGTILGAYDDEPTAIPELAKLVTGKPNEIDFALGPFPLSVAVRPASPTSTLPLTLSTLSRVQADYRAMAAFPNYVGAPISRLAPLPGVLDYDKDGEVVDLKAKQ